MAHYVYAPVAGENRVLVFAMDPASGKLTLKHQSELEAAPHASCFDPELTRLYVSTGMSKSPCVTCFAIEKRTGGLTQIGKLRPEGGPCYLSFDHTGRFLLMAYYSDGMVTVHGRNDDGTIQETAIDRHETQLCAHHIKTDPTNRYAFVPHVAGTNAIYQFLFDEKSGKLTPNAVPKIDAGPGQGPRHLEYHPTLDIAYTDNEQECSVTVYSFDRARGTLAPLQTVSTLPEQGAADPKSNAQLHIHPGGRSIYASNRGPDSIAMFAIDPATGLITSLGQQPSEAIPRPFGIDPDGDFLFAGGDGSPNLTAYRIDGRGVLEPLESYKVGTSTGWVLPVKF
jgi:6-phosphogluconolactonase